MSRTDALLALADSILAFHILIILFNLFGMAAIPLGAWRGWKFVRIFWWRALHLSVLAIVAVQAVLGRSSFLRTTDRDVTITVDILAAAGLVLRSHLCRGLRLHDLPLVACSAGAATRICRAEVK